MYVLPEDLRDKLKEPLGPVVNTNKLLEIVSNKRFIVSVGDFVTYTLLDNGVKPNICIYDFIVKRKKYAIDMTNIINSYDAKLINVKNPAGMITDELLSAVELAFKRGNIENFRIEVDGEEDLAALVAIYMAPTDVTVIYGMPNKGAVIVEATKANKLKVKDILNKM